MQNDRIIMILCACAWLISTYLLIRYLQRYNFLTVGLPMAFLLIFFLNNCGGFVYILPWYTLTKSSLLQGGNSFIVNQLGFVQTTCFLVTFTIGSIFGGSWLRRNIHFKKRKYYAKFVNYSLYHRLYLYVGIAFYFLYFVFKTINLSSVSSLFAQGLPLCAAAICIGCFDAQIAGDKRRYFYLLLLASTVFPILTLVIQGFISYASSAVSYVWGFVLVRQRLKWRHFFIFIAVFYLTLSIYVSYMQIRDNVRSIVWSGGDYSSRFDVVGKSLQSIQLFDIFNNDHLQLIDKRLNLNILVGQSVQYLDKTNKYANGETLYAAILAPIPRLLWPEKPTIAGGSQLVTRYSGRTFQPGVSVAMGYVMEMYANFGTIGVLIGGYVFGMILRLIDIVASEHLFRGELLLFFTWFLPGLTIIQPERIISVSIGAAAISFVLVKVINYTYFLFMPNSQSRNT